MAHLSWKGNYIDISGNTGMRKMNKKKNKHATEPVIETLYHLYRDEMMRTAYNILRDGSKAEDAVHDAFVRLLKNRETLDFEANSSAAKYYCITAARNAALDNYRKDKKYVDSPIIEVDITEKDTLDRCLERESAEALRDKLAKLKKNYRDIVILRHYYDHSFREIGTIVNVSEATARKRYQIAKKLLMEMIRKEGDFFER